MKLGKAFSDNVILIAHRKTRLTDSDAKSWWYGSGRALIFASGLVLCMFVLVWRLFELTVVRGHEFIVLADNNRTRELIRHAPRGRILDRAGRVLVDNIGQYRLLKPCEGSGQECVSRLSQEEGAKLLQSGLAPGEFVEVDYQRRYLYPAALAHVIGYTGELSPQELERDYYTLRGYRRGDKVGRVGVEAVYEDRLRGKDGKELVEVDARGRILRTLGRVAEVAGEDIILSLDADLAQAAADSFPAGRRGAVIVTNPLTGEVLTIFSSPTFDPNKFSQGMTQSEYDQLMGDRNRPLFDRAIGGVYPPGSTFKLVTALAGLAEGVLTKSTTFEDTGYVKAGGNIFHNWYFTKYGKTDGIVDIVKAIQRSNDIYFYKAGEAVGIEKLAKWAAVAGIGRPLGIELGGEAGGVMPDPDWKKSFFTSQFDLQARNNLWYTGDTFNTAIGQGYLLTTPLQVNAWANIVANGGKLCRPTISKTQKISPCPDLGIKKEHLDLIVTGMRKACEPGGTGWPLFDFSVKKSDQLDKLDQSVEFIPVACKTGTAEFGDPENHTHAWFTAFAPVPDPAQSRNGTGQAPLSTNHVISGEPEISVTVLVEEAGEGSDVAAPVAKKILERWFTR